MHASRSFLFLLLLPLLLGCQKATSRSTASLLSAESRREPKAKSVTAQDAPFIAGKKNRVYHVRNCQYAVSLDSAVGYASLREADASGKIPCEFCAPRTQAVAPVSPPATSVSRQARQE